MRKLRILFLLVLLLGLFTVANGPSFAQQATCPDGGEWTKVDSDDLSSYPVPGAVEYCFKAGSDNSQGCNGGLFSSWPQPEGTCGLSHWSYRIVTPPPPDDDDDEMCPWNPQLPIDSDLCVPPGDDDDETPPPPDDDDDRTPPPPPQTPPPGPGPKCGCYEDGTYACHLPPDDALVDPANCSPAPTPPAEVETGLFDEEPSDDDIRLAVIFVAVLVVLALILIFRSRSSE